MDDEIEFDSTSPISLSPSSIWLNDMEVPEGSLVRQLLKSRHKLTCTLCPNLEVEERMVAKGIDFSESQHIYLWKHKKRHSGSELGPYLFNIKTTTNSAVSFYLLFNLIKPASDARIRILTLPVHFESIEFSRVGECPSPRMLRIFRTRTPELEGCEVSMTYSARVYTDPKSQEEDIIYNILDVSLRITNTSAAKAMEGLGGQKVTMRAHGREYYGRANSVVTRGLSRTYSWVSNPKKEVEVTRDQMKKIVQDLTEIGSPREMKSPRRKSPGRKKMKKVSSNEVLPMLISPRTHENSRGTRMSRPSYIPDNDEYGNPMPMDEFFVILGDADHDPLILEFYNFERYPPSKRKISISFADILDMYLIGEAPRLKKSGVGSKLLAKVNLGRKKSPRSTKKLDIQIEMGAIVTLVCNAVNASEFKITEVSLRLDNYETYF